MFISLPLCGFPIGWQGFCSMPLKVICQRARELSWALHWQFNALAYKWPTSFLFTTPWPELDLWHHPTSKGPGSTIPPWPWSIGENWKKWQMANLCSLFRMSFSSSLHFYLCMLACSQSSIYPSIHLIVSEHLSWARYGSMEMKVSLEESMVSLELFRIYPAFSGCS